MTHGLIAGHERQKQDEVEEKNKLKADNPFFHIFIEVIDKNSGSHFSGTVVRTPRFIKIES
ncbi:hypothetical protein [Bacillus sp. Bos-x628]|uniref:hypothetical protein n=1 Tax=Bacillus maqinnsis TaxID=3229854 RepID=UPI00338EFA73